MSNKPLMIVAGAGAGLGQSLLQRFAAGEYQVVGLVRSLPESSGDLDLRQVDMTDADTAAAVIGDVITTYGPMSLT